MLRRGKIILVLLSLALAGTAGAQTSDADESDHVYKAMSGITPPRAVSMPEPEFSNEARAAGYQGVCTLAVIVEKDGMPSHIRVTRSLGMGLDEKAIAAVQRWRFEPARKDGEPVRAEITIEVDFHLYGRTGSKIAELKLKADSGDAKAQLDMAHELFKGESEMGKDNSLGETYLQRAANQGLAKAQFELGERLAQRDKPDYSKACMWLTLAERAGYKHSDKALKELSAKITPEQMQSGRSLADAWAPSSK